MKRPALLLSLVSVGFLVGVATSVAFDAQSSNAERGAGGTPEAQHPEELTPESPDLPFNPVQAPIGTVDPIRRTPVVEAVERVAPAVVSITTEVPVQDPFRVFATGQKSESSEGSGVVIAADGVVLTNSHVVESASRIKATFADGKSYEADVLGLSPELDLAVLRLRGAKGLTAVPIGTSADLMLGEPVIVIGNPFGLGHTVTTGVVSALERPIETDRRVYQDFIQTDAGINPGNSGGPLLNARGSLVGVTTAIRPDAENIGFAIPVDRAMKVARDLVAYGTVQVPWLGVDLEDIRFLDGQRRTTAARVVRVHPDGPALKAGIQAGDVVIGADGKTVQGRGDLNTFLAAFDSDRELHLQVARGDRRIEAAVRTGHLPESVVDAAIREGLGVELADDQGVVVRRVLDQGGFSRIGGQAGDRIIAVNGLAVRDVAAFRAAVLRVKSGHRPEALFTIRRGDRQASLTLSL